MSSLLASESTAKALAHCCPNRRKNATVLCVVLALGGPTRAFAAEVVGQVKQDATPTLDADTTIPSSVGTTSQPNTEGLSLNRTLEEAVASGFEIRLARIAVDAARADAKSFTAIANPALSLGYGHALGYDPGACRSCSPNQYTVGLSDQAALNDIISGKRGLREDISELSMRIAGLQRDDAIRTVKLAVKQQFAALAFSQVRLRVAQRVLEKTEETERLVQARFNAGAPMPDLLRAQAVVLSAKSDLRAAQIQLATDRGQLAVLLGRSRADNLVVDESLLIAAPPVEAENPFAVPHWIEQAKSTRPDRRAAQSAVEQSEAVVRLARRSRWPDVELQLGYTQQGLGSNAIQPGTISAAVSAPIPLLYQNQGQLERALADEAARHTERQRLDLQIAGAVHTALVNTHSVWEQVQHGQQRLERALQAVELVRIQYQEGATSLVDLLEATNSAIDAEKDYLDIRESMWNQVFQLEYAAGKELVK